VLAGPPGAGKGTQCSQLAQQHGMAHISIGDTLRQEVTHGTPLGSRIRASLETGRLVPDHDMSEVIAAQLAQHRAAPAVLLDGFPRTLGQAQILEQLRPRAVELVILLVVPLATLLQRLSDRSRPDDTDPNVITERLLAYDRDTKPVLDWYANRGLLTHVDATAPPHDVTTRIARHLTTIGLHTPLAQPTFNAPSPEYENRPAPAQTDRRASPVELRSEENTRFHCS
jgi:adenylate kinase